MVCNFFQSCAKRKRSIVNATLEAGEEHYKTGQLLHIINGNSAVTNLGTIYYQLYASAS